jgi:pyruvate dehydrogenase E1 component
MSDSFPDPTQIPSEAFLRDDVEAREWIESLAGVIVKEGAVRAADIVKLIQDYALKSGVRFAPSVATPYLNTIRVDDEVPYAGDLELERRIGHLVRWNAMAMVVKANRESSGIGGHIATFASCATLYEVAQNHFLRGRDHISGGDHAYFQGHASPGNYARAYLEGRISEESLHHFRRETTYADGLPSYPHPWLKPDFWEFPTVSMGLGPIQAIYRAKFMRYLENRGLCAKTDAKVWVFVGDGECDEPETLAAISLAVREKLDNLIFVVNCNLQRLDGPVRGNGKIIQELETIFRGVGWNTLKVVWGSEWDPLFAKDSEGLLVKRLTELVDGEYQKFYFEGPLYAHQRIFAGDPRLAAMVSDYSEADLRKIRVGGHDSRKVFAAYAAAVRHRGSPTVILAKTVKGYGLGAAGEGMNVTHQQKTLNEEELRKFRDRFDIPLSDQELATVPFHRPSADGPEMRYLQERRKLLGGYIPRRIVRLLPVELPLEGPFQELCRGSPHPIATTMAAVRLVSTLLHDKNIGARIVPIVADEARTFGMDALFPQCGIYSSQGSLYEPVDAGNLLYYKESKSGQLLEEGITEAGAMSSLIAAGTSYSTHGIAMLPFFFFYSMFGFQRIGDLIWAAGDCRTRGFLIGATAGRTTLAGEGLQHQDGQSHVLALAPPHVRAYDPAFAYEISVIIQDGIKRMFGNQEDLLYYLTVGNEPYPQPPMPDGVEEGILRGAYLYRKSAIEGGNHSRVHLFGSGSILNEVLRAQEMLAEKFAVTSDVWSVTSYKCLYQEASTIERWNRLHPTETRRVPYITQVIRDATHGENDSVVVAASDYLKALPDSIAGWIPGRFISLGTDGFGRSDGRKELRKFFEVDATQISLAALTGLSDQGRFPSDEIQTALEEFGIDPEKKNPVDA